MSLSELYRNYTQGKGDMDSRTFTKLCKDASLIDKKTTAADVDLIFTKCKGKGAKRLSGTDFECAMEELAKRKQVTLEELTASILEKTTGPTFTGTKAEAVRLHDDKTTFTGVHKHGGPTTVDKPTSKFTDTFSNYALNEKGDGRTAKIDLSDLCDRSAANVRGINKNFQM